MGRTVSAYVQRNDALSIRQQAPAVQDFVHVVIAASSNSASITMAGPGNRKSKGCARCRSLKSKVGSRSKPSRARADNMASAMNSGQYAHAAGLQAPLVNIDLIDQSTSRA